jgi:hypothetical protein
VLSVPQFEQRIGVDPIETNVPRFLSRLRFEGHLPVQGLAKTGLRLMTDSPNRKARSPYVPAFQTSQ